MMSQPRRCGQHTSLGVNRKALSIGRSQGKHPFLVQDHQPVPDADDMGEGDHDMSGDGDTDEGSDSGSHEHGDDN